jgi:hypothetical protein
LFAKPPEEYSGNLFRCGQLKMRLIWAGVSLHPGCRNRLFSRLRGPRLVSNGEISSAGGYGLTFITLTPPNQALAVYLGRRNYRKCHKSEVKINYAFLRRRTIGGPIIDQFELVVLEFAGKKSDETRTVSRGV